MRKRFFPLSIFIAVAWALGPVWAILAESTNTEPESVRLLRAVRNPSLPETNIVVVLAAPAAPPIAATPAAPTATNFADAGLINKMDALDNRYKLTISDKVSFRIVEDDDDAKVLTVTDSGDLDIPYIGRYAVAGKTCREVAQALKIELEKEYYYQATVIVAVDQWARSQGKIYIVGPVRSAGPQEIPSDENLTLSKAILRAGGFSDDADQRHVRVTRKSHTPGAKDEEFIVNVEDVLQKGNRQSDLTLEAGDLVYVPERLVHF